MKQAHLNRPTIIVIIGITGDLARRKLLPAIAAIGAAGELPSDFKLVGISRRAVTPEDVLADTPELDATGHHFLAEHLQMYQMDLEKPEDYAGLKNYLQQVEAGFGKPSQRLFYLSIPPQFTEPVVTCLGDSGLAAVPDTKLLLEKPFGTDLESTEQLAAATKAHFSEEQLYRIDHYLAKEMTQNIVMFRSHNPLFAHTWNNQFIEKIDIVAAEKIGVEGRGTFYEQTGALRDFIQSHLLQLAALTLMDVSGSDTGQTWQTNRLAALEQLLVPQASDIPQIAKRGQYQGYGEEAGNPHSSVETFVALTFFSKAPAWRDVPIRLITGKALDHKCTEIRVYYKTMAPPEQQTGDDTNAVTQTPNVVTLRLQPHEGIDIAIWVKKPGNSQAAEQLPLHLDYSDHYQILPEAYERVLLDAMQSDHSVFSSSQEVLAAWRLLEPIQHHWEMYTGDLIRYPRGATIEDVLKIDQA